eukprot:GFKZ01006332.1.p1 GENE.GFKZ01006332.1~~GFKZ01006332.1.p1  ORF type:complete len:1409 (+),score=208.09 GFKZ01006332.1:194-4420(+)
MQHDNAEPSPLDGLPVWVSDVHQVWPTLRIAKSVPLSRLEWLWTSRGISIRDSSSAARAVFQVSNAKSPTAQLPSRFPHDWYRNPYVYILVTTMKDFDWARESGWNRVRSFVEECREKMKEYLVLLAATDGDLDRHRRVVDRLRAEVNGAARGREHLVAVPPALKGQELRPITHLHHSPTHQDLLVRLRECAREGAEARVRAYEEEVAKNYVNRASPGWSFGEFFVLKEGMAFVFVQLGRRDVAVRFYDELQVLVNELEDVEKMVFCDKPATEAAKAVGNPFQKDCRSLLIAASITEIDLRIYLFARQLWLLLKDRKFSTLAERGLKFVTAVSRRCAEEALSDGGTVSGVFRDEWVFCTSRLLASTLTPAIPSPTEAENELSAQLGGPRERHTARLIAGFHVHALKALVGLAHVTMPGVLSPAESEIPEDFIGMAKEARGTSDGRLKEALSDPIKAEVLHAEIANAAASLYEMGGRARGAAALDGDSGIVRLRSKNYNEAKKLLSAQCSRFINDSGWDDLHRARRLELAHAEKALDRVQEYLVSCLTMLYMSRAARRRWRTLASPEEEESHHAEEAKFWAAETSIAAKRLPRVMKYKAERLFEVSVLTNNKTWTEGDPGGATVKVRSDIPTTLQVDSVMLECRCMSVNSAQSYKPALQQRLGSEAMMGPADNDTTSLPHGNVASPRKNSSSPQTSDCELPDTVLLSSDGSVEIQNGLNEINVTVNEVPRAGKYKVMLVALFVGNLKLVQTASKASPIPIVTTKGDALNKNALSSSASATSDYANGEVRFPIFFATRRDPSAVVEIGDDPTLYLVPETMQCVYVKITAGRYGVKIGSKLRCSLLSSTKSRVQALARFAAFSNVAEDDDRASIDPPLILTQRVPSESGNCFDTTEAVISRALVPNEVFECRLAVKALDNCGQYRDQSVDDESDSRSCSLHLQFSCFELDGSPTRQFTCRAEKTLTFICPFEITARVELTSEWGGDELVARAVGLDGTPLGDGGTLVCFIRSKLKQDHTITIHTASLELPSWSELRPDEPPAHVDLLPCTLGSHGLLTCAFDVLVRELSRSPQQRTLNSGGVERDNMIFDDRAAERRLNRSMLNAAPFESEDDIGQWTREKQSELSDPVAAIPPRNGGIPVAVPYDSAEGLTEQLEAGNETLKEVADAAGELPSYEGHERAVDPVNLRDVEASDVVDLSNGQDSSNVVDVQSPMPVPSDSVGILRLHVTLGSGEEGSVFERKIDVSALGGVRKRYRIERRMSNVGDNGKVMQLEFEIGTTTRSGSGEVENNGFHDSPIEELQYEIDADPTVWIVVGRRRGKVSLKHGAKVVKRAELIPVSCGRQRVPCIRLFKHDGRGLATSQYENVNEYMQVIVVPNRSVVRVCGMKRTEEGGNDGSMPVVIASDSFFGN